jgi:hypothetical protein
MPAFMPPAVLSHLSKNCKDERVRQCAEHSMKMGNAMRGHRKKRLECGHEDNAHYEKVMQDISDDDEVDDDVKQQARPKKTKKGGKRSNGAVADGEAPADGAQGLAGPEEDDAAEGAGDEDAAKSTDKPSTNAKKDTKALQEQNDHDGDGQSKTGFFRGIYNSNNEGDPSDTTTFNFLPGKKLRLEGQRSVSDKAANQAYQNTLKVLEFYKKFCEHRCSVLY